MGRVYGRSSEIQVIPVPEVGAPSRSGTAVNLCDPAAKTNVVASKGSVHDAMTAARRHIAG
jgi:hypothetical protein